MNNLMRYVFSCLPTAMLGFGAFAACLSAGCWDSERGLSAGETITVRVYPSNRKNCVQIENDQVSCEMWTDGMLFHPREPIDLYIIMSRKAAHMIWSSRTVLSVSLHHLSREGPSLVRTHETTVTARKAEFGKDAREICVPNVMSSDTGSAFPNGRYRLVVQAHSDTGRPLLSGSVEIEIHSP
jgi:hypothetical protein